MLALAAVAACGPGAASRPSGGAGEVRALDFKFQPATVTVERGGSLTFLNGDQATHTVTEGRDGDRAPAAHFDEQLPEAQSVRVVFADSGTYAITCTFHPTMNMTVTVP